MARELRDLDQADSEIYGLDAITTEGCTSWARRRRNLGPENDV